jgi:predicted anti-sigma-YlaC factor YlaD
MVYESRSPLCVSTLTLQALLDNELDVVNAVAVEAHIANCLSCSGRLNSMKALLARFVRTGASLPTPPNLSIRIENQIARESQLSVSEQCA